MLLEITQALSSLKAITDLQALILKSKVDAAVLDKAIALGSTIISLQQAITAMRAEYDLAIQEKDELKQQLRELREWQDEAGKYCLTDLGYGTFVYAVKNPEHSKEPQHWLCPNCHQKLQKSIFQSTGKGVNGVPSYQCPNCNCTIVTELTPDQTPKAKTV